MFDWRPRAGRPIQGDNLEGMARLFSIGRKRPSGEFDFQMALLGRVGRLRVTAYDRAVLCTIPRDFAGPFSDFYQ